MKTIAATDGVGLVDFSCSLCKEYKENDLVKMVRIVRRAAKAVGLELHVGRGGLKYSSKELGLVAKYISENYERA